MGKTLNLSELYTSPPLHTVDEDQTNSIVLDNLAAAAAADDDADDFKLW